MCGIVGITRYADVSFSLYYALYALQHRGQESAGIATFNGAGLLSQKPPGSASFNGTLPVLAIGVTKILEAAPC